MNYKSILVSCFAILFFTRAALTDSFVNVEPQPSGQQITHYYLINQIISHSDV